MIIMKAHANRQELPPESCSMSNITPFKESLFLLSFFLHNSSHQLIFMDAKVCRNNSPTPTTELSTPTRTLPGPDPPPPTPKQHKAYSPFTMEYGPFRSFHHYGLSATCTSNMGWHNKELPTRLELNHCIQIWPNRTRSNLAGPE